MLKINNLTKKYGEFFAVDNLRLQVLSGEICAFIGHNGAGKTTTLKAIAGIINFEGEIFVDGVDVKNNPVESKRRIGYLADNPDMYPNLSGIDYLNFVADVFAVSKKDRKDRIDHYAKRLGIYQSMGNLISTMSLGMKQKIALVSVFLHQPKLYLFDEPFVGLDPTSSFELKRIMKEECEKGCAIFYSTHVLEVVEKLCSHVAVIKNGKLIAHGRMEDVKKSSDLEKTFMELEEENE